MISFIEGTIEEKTESGIVIENQGMGYEIFMTGNACDQLTIGKKARIYTYFQVREDAAALYGFRNRDELGIFRLLLSVNGIGPKAALGILSGITPDELRFAVLSEDVKTLAKAPGIGKKTAQKVILELKDKMSLADAFEKKLSNTAEAAEEELPNDAARKEAVEALTALGYSSTDALRAVRAVPAEAAGSVESLLKTALKNM